MHLPHLRECTERFDVRILCDVSPGALRFAGERWFPDADRTRSWENALSAELDAVFVLTPGSHAPVAIAAAEAGMHVFVEKPVGLSVAEGMAMTDTAEKTGVCLMAGYMKRYDPAVGRLREHLGLIGDLALARVTTLEAPLEPYVAVYPLSRPADVDPGLLDDMTKDDHRRVVEAIGERAAADPTLHRAYRHVLLDCLIHELNLLRGLLGEPDELRFATVSKDARAFTVGLRFGQTECVLMWADLPELTEYRQEFAFYGPRDRATLVFPSPFLRNTPPRLVIEGGQPSTNGSWRREEIVSYEEPFKTELLEFHDAIIEEREPRTPVRDGVRDLALARAVMRCLESGAPVPDPTGGVAAAIAEMR
jgi:predicted dehydrogenase